MNIPFEDAEPFTKSLEPAAAGLSKETFKFGRSRFESEAYDHFLPVLALHGAMLSVGILIEFEADWIIGTILAAFGGALIATHIVLQSQKRSTHPVLLGSSAAFFTGSALAFRLEGSVAALVIALPYATLSVAALVKLVDPRVLRTSPVYSAAMLIFVHDVPAGFVGYLLSAVIAAIVLFRIERLELLAAFLVGAALISPNIDNPGARLAWDLIAVGGTLFYATRFVQPNYSEVRNFLTLAFTYIAATLIMRDLDFFSYKFALRQIIEFVYQWRSVLGLALLAVILAPIGYYKAYTRPLVGLWLFIEFFTSSVAWLSLFQGPDSSVSISLGDWQSVILLPSLATILYFVGLRYASQAICNLARLGLLASAVATMRLAESFHEELFKSFFDLHQPVVDSLSDFFVRSSGAAATTLIGLVLVVGFAIASYDKNSFAASIPWWKGLFSKRRIALWRSEYRAVDKSLEKTPIVKEAWKAFRGARELGKFLKTGSAALSFADVVAVMTFLFVIFAAAYLLDSYMIWSSARHTTKTAPDTLPKISQLWPRPKDLQWWTPVASWSAGAVCLYLTGIVRRQSLFFFVGAVFAFVPFAKYFTFNIHPLLFCRLLISLGLTLALCSMLRWLFYREISRRPPAAASTGPSRIAPDR